MPSVRQPGVVPKGRPLPFPEGPMNCLGCGMATGILHAGAPLCLLCRERIPRTPTNQLPAHNLLAEVRCLTFHLENMMASHDHAALRDAHSSLAALVLRLEGQHAP